MKKEFKLFFKKKYYVVFLVILTYFIFSFIMTVTNAGQGYEDSNSQFCYGVEKYNSESSLENLINRAIEYHNKLVNGEVDGITQEDIDGSIFEINRYESFYKNNIKYDTTVDYNDAMLGGLSKHTPFHLYGTLSTFLFILAIFLSCILGPLVATSDFLNKTAKLVYTNGQKKQFVMFKKYITSLLIMLSVTLFISILSCVIGLSFSNSGVTTCYLLFGENFIFMNYAQFTIIQILNLMLFEIVIYTLLFYFSVICKNTIIALSINMGLQLAVTYFNFELPRVLTILKNMSTSGILAFSDLKMTQYSTNPLEMIWFLVYVALAVIAVIIGNIAIKKYDFSR